MRKARPLKSPFEPLQFLSVSEDQIKAWFPPDGTLPSPSVAYLQLVVTHADQLATALERGAPIKGDPNSIARLPGFATGQGFMQVTRAIGQLETILNPRKFPWGDLRRLAFSTTGWDLNVSVAHRAIREVLDQHIDTFSMRPICDGTFMGFLPIGGWIAPEPKPAGFIEVDQQNGKWPPEIDAAMIKSLKSAAAILHECCSKHISFTSDLEQAAKLMREHLGRNRYSREEVMRAIEPQREREACIIRRFIPGYDWRKHDSIVNEKLAFYLCKYANLQPPHALETLKIDQIFIWLEEAADERDREMAVIRDAAGNSPKSRADGTQIAHEPSGNDSSEAAGPSARPDSSDRPRHILPQYDPDRRELVFDGRVLKQFRQPAKNQERVLVVFQEEKWPMRIDDPLDPGRLNETIRALNENMQANLIRFVADGKGEGVRWEPVT
jgi:hypothetical protein